MLKLITILLLFLVLLESRSIFSSLRTGKKPNPCPQLPKPVELKKIPIELKEAFSLSDLATKELAKAINTTALSMVIMYNHQKIHEFYYDSTGNNSVDENTRFRIGSISKVFTDLMLVKLRDQGKVNLDDEVQKYWPDFNITTRWGKNSRPITFLQLARQLSGLPGGTPCAIFYPGGCNITTEEAFFRLNQDSRSIYPTDYYPHYSDVAFEILGRALEQPAGMTWEDFQTNEIINPLGMTNTGWEYPPEEYSKFAPPYFWNQGVLNSSLAFVDMLWARPTGGMYSTAHDLSLLLDMFLSANEDKDDEVVLGSSLREMLLPGYINDDQISGFGFPMEIEYNPKAKTWMYTKSGLFPGYTATIIMVPKINFGITVLCNSLADTSGFIASELVLPVLKDILWSLQTTPNPGNLSKFEGNYTPQNAYPPLLASNVTIVANETTSTLFYYSYSPFGLAVQQLQWIHGNSFLITSSVSDIQATSCMTYQISSEGEILRFHADAQGNVDYFFYEDTEPYYGWVYSKMSSK